MIKKLLLISITFLACGFLSTSLTNYVNAQGIIRCSTAFGDCNISSGECDSDAVNPCISGDCCLAAYQQTGDCPLTLACKYPTPTPGPLTPKATIQPTPTHHPDNCPGPFGMWCGGISNYGCPSGQTCSTGAVQHGMPDTCSGMCVDENPIISPHPTGAGLRQMDLCELTDDEDCATCIDEGNVWTAIGCINSDPAAFTSQFLALALGISGGLALLIMLVGAVTIITSNGNPEKVASGQQTITGAALGLLFIIFSVVILNIIGVEILQIPGL